MDEAHQLLRISENCLKMFSYFRNYAEKFMYSLLVAYQPEKALEFCLLGNYLRANKLNRYRDIHIRRYVNAVFLCKDDPQARLIARCSASRPRVLFKKLTRDLCPTLHCAGLPSVTTILLWFFYRHIAHIFLPTR